MLVDFACFAWASKADGPGSRLVIWVRGCSHNCPHCANEWMKKRIRRKASVAALVHLVVRAKKEHGIEGITFCGGEPFDQAEPLAVVARNAHALGLSVVSFSGYVYEELQQAPFTALLEQTDILIDGPYIHNLPENNRHWVGSTNQRVIYLTDRYAPGLEHVLSGERIIGPLSGLCGPVYERIE